MAEEKLICPLILVSIPTKPGLAHCKKEKCAWWYSRKTPKEEKCSILKIAQALKSQQPQQKWG